MLIDQKKIDELKNIPHKEGTLLDFCLKHFKKDLNKKLEYLNNMDENNDCRKIEQELHHFKSSCLNIGAIELADACNNIIDCTQYCAINCPECLGNCVNAEEFRSLGEETLKEIKKNTKKEETT